MEFNQWPKCNKIHRPIFKHWGY